MAVEDQQVHNYQEAVVSPLPTAVERSTNPKRAVENIASTAVVASTLVS